jgi:hypothetical protein
MPNDHDRPPLGRSRTQRGLRSCSVASTPHRGQPVPDSVVSISSSSSPPYSAAATTTKPGSPSVAVAVSIVPRETRSAVACPSTWDLRSACLGRLRILRSQAGLLRQAEDRVAISATTLNDEEPQKRGVTAINEGTSPSNAKSP